jgi:hypothetical protein
MFEFEIAIKRDYAVTTMPAGMTNSASTLLRTALDGFGFCIPNPGTISNIEFAELINKSYDNEKAKALAKELVGMVGLTVVIYSDENRNPENVVFKYSVIGCNLDDAEMLADDINDHEIVKDKYADSKERRMSVFTLEGGELKSGIFQVPQKQIAMS